MKRTLIALATLIAMPIAASTAIAGFGPGGMGPSMRGGPNPEYMARVLDLTTEQQEKLKVLWADHAKQRDEMRAAMQSQMQTKMQAILTKEQYDKMAELRQYRKGGRGQGMGPGAGPGMGVGMGSGCTGMGPRGAW